MTVCWFHNHIDDHEQFCTTKFSILQVYHNFLTNFLVVTFWLSVFLVARHLAFGPFWRTFHFWSYPAGSTVLPQTREIEIPPGKPGNFLAIIDVVATRRVRGFRFFSFRVRVFIKPGPCRRRTRYSVQKKIIMNKMFEIFEKICKTETYKNYNFSN